MQGGAQRKRMNRKICLNYIFYAVFHPQAQTQFFFYRLFVHSNDSIRVNWLLHFPKTWCFHRTTVDQGGIGVFCGMRPAVWEEGLEATETFTSTTSNKHCTADKNVIQILEEYNITPRRPFSVHSLVKARCSHNYVQVIIMCHRTRIKTIKFHGAKMAY